MAINGHNPHKREAKVICLIGTRHTGKTHFIREAIKTTCRPKVICYSRHGAGGEIFQNMPIIKKEDILDLDKGIVQVTDPEVEKVFAIIGLPKDGFTNGLLVLDDAGATLGLMRGNAETQFETLLGQCRYNFTDVILSFGDPKKVPDFIYGSADYICLFNVLTSPEQWSKKIPPKLIEAYKRVKEQIPTNKHYYETLNMLD